MPEAEPRTLELRDYLRVVRRRKWTVLLAFSWRYPPPWLSRSARRRNTRRTPSSSSSRSSSSRSSHRQLAGAAARPPSRISPPRSRSWAAPRCARRSPRSWDVPPARLRSWRSPARALSRSGRTAPTLKKPPRPANVYAGDLHRGPPRAGGRRAVSMPRSRSRRRSTSSASRSRTSTPNSCASPPAGGGERGAPTDPRVTERARLEGQRTTYLQQLDRIQTGAAVDAAGRRRGPRRGRLPGNPLNKTPVRNGVAGLALGSRSSASRSPSCASTSTTRSRRRRTSSASSGLTVVGLIPSLARMEEPQGHAARRRWPSRARTRPRPTARCARRSSSSGSTTRSAACRSRAPWPREGKTTTLSNLATTFAKAGQRVIVLCCDLRRPRVHEFFGLTNQVGFTSVLLGEAPLSDAIQQVPGDLPLGLVVVRARSRPTRRSCSSSKRAAGIDRGARRPVRPPAHRQPSGGAGHRRDSSSPVSSTACCSSPTPARRRSAGLARAVELLRQVDAPLIGAVLNGVRSGVRVRLRRTARSTTPTTEPQERRERAAADAERRAAGPRRRPACRREQARRLDAVTR